MDGIEDRIQDAGDYGPSAISAQRRSELRSPCADGISTGMALPSPAMSSESLLQAQQEIGAVCAPRLSSSISAELTLTRRPTPLTARTLSSRMRKPLVLQTAEIDDVGAGRGDSERARNDLTDRQLSKRRRFRRRCAYHAA